MLIRPATPREINAYLDSVMIIGHPAATTMPRDGDGFSWRGEMIAYWRDGEWVMVDQPVTSGRERMGLHG
jgi:hypothetical protein